MSNIVESAPPRQPPALAPATPLPLFHPHPLHALRHRRAVALAPTVRPVRGGYRVASSQCDREYLVSRPSGQWLCTCADHQRHEDEADFLCKHAMAVEMALERGLSPAAADNAPAPHTPTAEAAVRLKLIKNTKGYSWELTVAEDDGPAALAKVKELEEKVRAQFGAGPSSRAPDATTQEEDDHGDRL